MAGAHHGTQPEGGPRQFTMHWRLGSGINPKSWLKTIPIDKSMNQQPDIRPGISSARLAVLIDAENVSAELWPEIRRRIDLLGRPTVTRAYTCGKAGKWQSIPGVEVVDGGNDVAGKDAADFLLAFDAGKLSADDGLDQFVIVSGDDGIAPLIRALKSASKVASIIVPTCGNIGDRKTLRVADMAIVVPQAKPPARQKAVPQPNPNPNPKLVPPPAAAAGNCLPESDRKIIFDIIMDRGKLTNGWAHVAEIGTALSAHKTIKRTGKLSSFLASLDFVEIRDPKTGWCTVRVRPNSHIET
jgi:hypothetical protein